MNISHRISAFAKLSDLLIAVANENPNLLHENLSEYHELNDLVKNIKIHNPWFIEKFVRTQLLALGQSITKKKLEKWTAPYSTRLANLESKRIGVVMAGNIALVGFHDFVTVLIAGHHFVGKLSSKDAILPRKIAEILIKIENQFAEKITLKETKLTDFDAIIATGSNNTARYFEYYFSKVPNIIRKSRNSVAILSDNETEEDLLKLTDDIFLHFGLGCRNISKIFVPKNYNFNKLYGVIEKRKDIINHHKYANNYDYYRAIFLMNNIKFFDNNFFIIKPDSSLHSAVAVLHYEEYENLDFVNNYLKNNADNLQCVATKIRGVEAENIVALGQTQFPQISDYEDNINTLDFLVSL